MAANVGVTLDWTISLGTLIHLIGVILALLTTWVKLNDRLTKLETMVTPVWEWFNSDNRNGNTHAVDRKIDQAVQHAVRNAVQEIWIREELRKRDIEQP